MTAGQALLDFCALLDTPPDDVRGAETIRDLHLRLDRTADAFARVSPEQYDALLRATGGALSLQIGLPNLPPLLNIDAGQPAESTAEAQRAIQGMDPALTLRLNLSLAKGPLLAHWGLNGGDCYLLPFVYKDAFLRLLHGDLPTLDQYLFAAPDRATLVVVEEEAPQLSGPLLHVAGVGRARALAAAAGPLNGRLQQRLLALREVAAAELSWSGFHLANITPLHLLVSEAANGSLPSDDTLPDGWFEVRNGSAAAPQSTDSDVARLLAAHALAATILYTANRSGSLEDGMQARYAGTDNTADLLLPAPAPNPVPDSAALARWSIWPFAAGGVRLPFLQNVVARQLRADDPAANYAALHDNLGHLLDEARRHYRVFVDGRIEAHFQTQQRLEETTAAAITAVSSAIDSLTRGFVEALLGAIGVIVLTLIAALVAQDISTRLFQVAMWGYAAYLILFQGLYRLGSQVHSFLLLRRETADRLAAYQQRLGRRQVAGVRSALEARERQFWLWLGITAVLYLLIALGLIVVAARLP